MFNSLKFEIHVPDGPPKSEDIERYKHALQLTHRRLTLVISLTFVMLTFCFMVVIEHYQFLALPALFFWVITCLAFVIYRDGISNKIDSISTFIQPGSHPREFIMLAKLSENDVIQRYVKALHKQGREMTVLEYKELKSWAADQDASKQLREAELALSKLKESQQDY